MKAEVFDIAAEIVENFRRNVGEGVSTSWVGKPWVKHFFPQTTSYSFMVDVKEAIEHTIGNDGVVQLSFGDYLLTVTAK